MSLSISLEPSSDCRVLIWRHSVVEDFDFVPDFLAQFLGVQLAWVVMLDSLGYAPLAVWRDPRISSDSCDDDEVTDAGSVLRWQRGARTHMDNSSPIEPPVHPRPDQAWKPAERHVPYEPDASVQTGFGSSLSAAVGRSCLKKGQRALSRKSISFSFEVVFWFPDDGQVSLSQASRNLALRMSRSRGMLGFVLLLWLLRLSQVLPH